MALKGKDEYENSKSHREVITFKRKFDLKFLSEPHCDLAASKKAYWTTLGF